MTTDRHAPDDPWASDPLRFVETIALLRRLTAQLVVSTDLDEALRQLTATAADLVSGRGWCAMTVIRAGGPTTAAASGTLPVELDEAQYRFGDGPCLTAIRTREMVLVVDLATDSRWPQWRDHALGQDVRGVLAVPVDIDDHVLGALNLYADDPDGFPPGVELAAMLVAEHAGLLLSAVLDRTRLTGVTADLTAALGDGETVNRAIGILMAQRSCSADAALDVLQRAATTLRLPLPTIAARLVDTVATRSM